MRLEDFPNLLWPAFDPDLEIPPHFDEYDSRREDHRAETRKADWVWREARDSLASCLGDGEATANALEAFCYELPRGMIRLRLIGNTDRYRRAEAKRNNHERNPSPEHPHL
jgi:hypothetical protein